MLHKIIAHVILDVKILFTEKIVLLWSVFMPVCIALIFQRSLLQSITSEEQFAYFLSMFWIFIIIASHINGVGLQIAKMREYNLLKTYIFIAGAKHPYIISVFITQAIFGGFSLLLFTSIMSAIYSQYSLDNFALPLVLWILSLPIGFASLFLVALPLKLNSIATLTNISLYPLFLLSMNDSLPGAISWLNPFSIMRHLADLLLYFTGRLDSFIWNPFIFIMLIVLAAIGFISYKKMNLLSLVQR